MRTGLVVGASVTDASATVRPADTSLSILKPQITSDAIHAIHAQARGLPRAINRLAITALLAAYAAGKTIVDESSARTAISEEATAASG